MRSQKELDAIISELREAHWALRTPLRTHALRQLFRDQKIPVAIAQLPVRAMTIMQFGRAAVCMSNTLSAREASLVLAEEYAHAKLHVGELGELTTHLSAIDANDPREFEARYVAECLVAGPGVDVAYLRPLPPPSILIAVASPVNPWRDLVPLEFDPYADDYVGGVMPVQRDRVSSSDDVRHALRTTRRQAGTVLNLLVRKPRFSLDPSPEIERLKYLGEGRFRFFDGDDRQWTVYDFDVVMSEGRACRKRINAGEERAKMRLFVSIGGIRRVYLFADRRELREVCVRHLERQLRDSKGVAVAPVRAVEMVG